MAKTVFRSETIELLDGTSVTLRPLSIKNMRKFQSAFAEMQTEESAEQDVDAALDSILGLARVCLSQDNKALLDEETEDNSIEDKLDLDSAYKIIEVCSGIKLNDPNLVAAAAAMLAAE
jgi:hypothetical protein